MGNQAMIKNIYTEDGSKFIRSEEAVPMQGIDVCHFCGEDLYSMGGQPCPDSKTGHYWVQYGEDKTTF